MGRSRLASTPRLFTVTLPVVLALALFLSTLVLAAPTTNRALAIPASNPSSYLPRFAKASGGWDSILYVQNTFDSETQLTLLFHGTPDVEINRVMPPRSTLIFRSDSVEGLPASWDGSIVVWSDNWVDTLVYLTRSQGRLFGGYRGAGWGSYLTAYYGPLWNDGSRSSALTVQNIARDEGSVPADMQAEFFDFSGATVGTQSLTTSPTAASTFDTPAGGPYWARVIGAGDTPLYGVVSTFDTAGAFVNVHGSLPVATDSAIPRTLKAVDNRGIGSRTTRLFVANPPGGQTPIDLNLRYFRSDGTVFATSPFSLPVGGASLIEVNDQADLPAGGAWAAGVSGAPGIQTVMGEQTIYSAASAASPFQMGAYGAPPDQLIGLPRLARTLTGEYSVITVHNVSPVVATVNLSYRDLDGTVVHTASVDLPARGWETWDLRDITALGNNFQGSGFISVSGTEAPTVMAWVDGYAGAHRAYLPSVRDKTPE